MDGSRRFSKVYGKTESGADALTSARGVLSSSARQLLILVDGQRDLRELAGIFGEDALNRLLPQLESQGYVRDLSEAPEPSEPPAPPVPPVPPAPLEPRQALERSGLSETPGPASKLRAFAGPAHTEEPAAVRSEPPRRYLAVPLAVLASLLTALGIVYWIFAREQTVAESVPVAANAPSALPVPETARRPPAASPLPDSPAAVRAPTSEPPPALPSEVTPEPPRAPAPASALPAPEAKPVPAPRPAEATVRKPEAPKAPPESSALATGTGPAKPEGSSAAPSAPLTIAGDRAAAAGSAESPPGPSPMLHERSRVLPTISKKAQRSGIYAGSAVVRLHVNSAGAVERVELVSASPPQVYDQDVEQALKQWTFDPPGNSAVMTVELDFRPQSVTPPAARDKPKAPDKPTAPSKLTPPDVPADAP